LSFPSIVEQTPADADLVFFPAGEDDVALTMFQQILTMRRYQGNMFPHVLFNLPP